MRNGDVFLPRWRVISGIATRHRTWYGETQGRGAGGARIMGRRLPRLRRYVHVREACARQIVARRHVPGGPWGMGERVEIAPGRLENYARFLGKRWQHDMMLGLRSPAG